jgi:hypothetical protein
MWRGRWRRSCASPWLHSAVSRTRPVSGCFRSSVPNSLSRARFPPRAAGPNGGPELVGRGPKVHPPTRPRHVANFAVPPFRDVAMAPRRHFTMSRCPVPPCCESDAAMSRVRCRHVASPWASAAHSFCWSREKPYGDYTVDHGLQCAIAIEAVVAVLVWQCMCCESQGALQLSSVPRFFPAAQRTMTTAGQRAATTPLPQRTKPVRPPLQRRAKTSPPRGRPRSQARRSLRRNCRAGSSLDPRPTRCAATACASSSRTASAARWTAVPAPGLSPRRRPPGVEGTVDNWWP